MRILILTLFGKFVVLKKGSLRMYIQFVKKSLRVHVNMG